MQEAKQSKKQQRDAAYNQYITNVTPKNSLALNMLRAFLVGGIICTIGQVCMNLMKQNGVEQETATGYTTLILVGLAVLLTGFHVFGKIAQFGGAGALVPITGFANSVASPAIEFKKEGQVFGIGCKIFTIAGPVILYGIFCSWVLGLIYWALKLWGVV